VIEKEESGYYLGDHRKNKENRRCDNDVSDENDDEILRERITKGVQ